MKNRYVIYKKDISYNYVPVQRKNKIEVKINLISQFYKSESWKNCHVEENTLQLSRKIKPRF